MARRSPDGDGDPEFVEFGIPVLDDRIEDAGLEFPVRSEDVERALGSVEIPYDAHGHTVTVAAALRQADRDAFESKHELLEALHPVFEARRRRSSAGLLEAFRSVLPF